MKVIIKISTLNGTYAPYHEYISKDNIIMYVPKGTEITLELNERYGT